MKTMSKEMLEAFRILEEDKNIKKEDIIDAVNRILRSAYYAVMVNLNHVLLNSMTRRVIFMCIRFVKWSKKFLTAV